MEQWQGFAQCEARVQHWWTAQYYQNVRQPADLATSLRPLALRLPWKTLLMPSCAVTPECDRAMCRVDIAFSFPSCNYYAAHKHSFPHIHL